MASFKVLSTAMAYVILLSVVTPASAQKESEIVSRLKKALRKCAIDEPEPPVVLKGKITMSNMDFSGTVHYHKPHNRLDLSFGEMKFINYQNDSIRWSYNSAIDAHEITRVSKEELQKDSNREKTLDFASKDLLYYKERGHQLKSNGIQQLDSLKVYALDLTKKDGSLVQIFVNTKTNLIYKLASNGDDRYYIDYRTYGDYVYPNLMVTNVSGNFMKMKFTEVMINATIPDSMFTIPKVALDRDKKQREELHTNLVNADELFNKGEYEKAGAAYHDILKTHANNFRALNGRGLCKVRSQKYYEAIADFNQALELLPTGGVAFNNRGLAKFYLGDNSGALDDYTSAIKLDSQMAMAFKNRGLLFLRMKRFEESAADFRHAKKLNDKDGEAHFKYAVAIAQLEKYDEALESYRHALLLNYKTAEMYNYKGVTEFKLEQYDSAATSFKTAMDLDAKNLQYLENYGNALYYLGSYDMAKKQFENYINVQNDNPEIYNLIGLCKYHDEDFKGAIKDFTKSIELNPKAPVYFDNRASAKELIDDYEGAIADYSQSIALYPNDASIFYKRGMIKIRTSKKIEGCLDLGTANEMKLEVAKEAIIQHCN